MLGTTERLGRMPAALLMVRSFLTIALDRGEN